MTGDIDLVADPNAEDDDGLGCRPLAKAKGPKPGIVSWVMIFAGNRSSQAWLQRRSE